MYKMINKLGHLLYEEKNCGFQFFGRIDMLIEHCLSSYSNVQNGK